MVLSRPPTSIKIISKSENFLISLFIVGVVIDIAVISSFSLNARKAKLLACLPSPSIINTFLLSCAAATAKLQVKVDFPTPPLVFTILITYKINHQPLFYYIYNKSYINIKQKKNIL